MKKDLVKKALLVFDSCKTPGQLNVALEFSKRVIAEIPEDEYPSRDYWEDVFRLTYKAFRRDMEN